MTDANSKVAARQPRRRPLARLHPLTRYILRRVGVGIALALVVSALVFAGTQVLPGDAANAVLGRSATPAALHDMREQLGLDRPVTAQYASWLGRLVRGDLGTSLAAQRPVSSLIWQRIGNTLILAAVALVLLLPISLTLGVWSGIRQGRPVDHVVSATSLAVVALPEFVTGTLLAVAFGVSWQILPAVSLVLPGTSPLSTPEVLVLPVLTLLLAGLAYTVRMVRAGVADAMSSECVQMARVNGIGERRVILRYGLRNALAPTIQTLASTVQWLVGGVVVTETVFQYPGIGQGLAQAVAVRDIPTVQAIAMLLALVNIGINIVADVIVVLLIPKLRTAQ